MQGSVYMVAGAGSNVTVQVGGNALFVVDTNEAAMSDKILAAIKTISPLPIRYIVNTSADPDHVGGNERLAKSAGDNSNRLLRSGRAGVRARERLRADDEPEGWRGGAAASALWPTDSFAAPLKIAVRHRRADRDDPSAGRAHRRRSDGLLPQVRRRQSPATSSPPIGYPVIDAKHGGTMQRLLDGLNRLIDIAIPEFNSMGGTRVIPGHGRICNEIDLVEYRDAVTIIADRITQLVLDDQVARTGEGRRREPRLRRRSTAPRRASGRPTCSSRRRTARSSANLGPWKARLLRNVPTAELALLSPKSALAARKVIAAAKPVKKGADDPLEGRWVLNVFESSYEPASLLPYRREIVITLNGNETTHAVSSWRRPQGNGSPLATYTYTATLDGKVHPIPNQGKANVSLKRVDANTIERTLDGEDVGKETSTWKLSADRKSLTVVAKGTDATGVAYTSTQVYEKQN